MTPSDTAHPEGETQTPIERAEPGPFAKLVEQEWQTLLDKDDRTSPEDYPDMCLITRVELAGAMSEAFFAGSDAARSTPPSRPQGEEGLAQEPKYRFDGGRVINRASGEAIPLDEPVFIFRARDLHAQGTLEEYATRVFDPTHKEAIAKRIGDFKRFRQSHPERMKEPDTDLSTPPSLAQGEEAIGPRAVDRATCEGCPAFKSEWWKDHLDNDETDSGTRAHCTAADKHITEYWSPKGAPPTWCPALSNQGKPSS